MIHKAAEWNRQKQTWASLRGLHARPLDLQRIALIRGADVETLSDSQQLESLLLALGLNDEAINELPSQLHPYCGQGLRLWQYPNQFSKYLCHLSRLAVRSYLEIGIRHGGSFVTTTEYLQRFHPLDFAVGVDVIACPSMALYQGQNPKAQFWCLNTRHADFTERLDRLGPIDLAFVDSHHEEDQCRSEFEMLAERADLIAFHDVANIGCPGVEQVWQEVRRLPTYDCFEYVDQYADRGPFMGIGLAVKKGRLQEPAGK